MITDEQLSNPEFYGSSDNETVELIDALRVRVRDAERAKGVLQRRQDFILSRSWWNLMSFCGSSLESARESIWRLDTRVYGHATNREPEDMVKAIDEHMEAQR